MPEPATIEVERALVESDGTLPARKVKTGADRKKHVFLEKRHEKLIIKRLKALVPLYKIANELDVTRQTLYNYIRAHMDEVYRDIRESMVDIAERSLMKNVKDGNQNAIEFLLNNQGRERGYGEQHQKDRMDVPIINFGRIEINKAPDNSIQIPTEPGKICIRDSNGNIVEVIDAESAEEVS